jgi:hypothetical protein
MTHSIGSFGPIGIRGLADAAVDRADTTGDAADLDPEAAVGLLAAIRPQPSRAERQRVVEEPAESADGDSAEPGDDGPSRNGATALDIAPQVASMAAMVERVVQAPLYRLPGDGASIRRIDRRRKRSC